MARLRRQGFALRWDAHYFPSIQFFNRDFSFTFLITTNQSFDAPVYNFMPIIVARRITRDSYPGPSHITDVIVGSFANVCRRETLIQTQPSSPAAIPTPPALEPDKFSLARDGIAVSFDGYILPHYRASAYIASWSGNRSTGILNRKRT